MIHWRRLLTVAIALLFLLALPTENASGAAQKRSRSHPTSSSHKSNESKTEKTSRSTPNSTGKTVHVQSYTRKDGTRVQAHDRRAPGAGTGASSTQKSTTAKTPRATKPPKAPTYSSSRSPRDSSGRIHRSEGARETFMRQTGYPKGRPGYVVDHIVPLACGGADDPGNMQWQTVAAAKAKDKTERKGCR